MNTKAQGGEKAGTSSRAVLAASARNFSHYELAGALRMAQRDIWLAGLPKTAALVAEAARRLGSTYWSAPTGARTTEGSGASK